MNQIQVYEITLNVSLLKDIEQVEEYTRIAAFIDSGLGEEADLLELHETNQYKGYVFSLFHPVVKEGIYRSHQIYKIRIRTVDQNLAKFFDERLVHHHSIEMKGLSSDIKILPKHPIEKLYSLTPAVLKTDEGYWKTHMSLEDFERRMVENLIKKYNLLTGDKLDENFRFYTSLEFTNSRPIAIPYKGVKILGDKLELIVDQSKTAQELAYMCLGTGLLEMNARGAGYVNYRWV